MDTTFRDRAFERHAREVEGMVDRGIALAEVERVLAETELHEDDRAALWLLAWSDLADDGRYRRRRTARPVPLIGGGV